MDRSDGAYTQFPPITIPRPRVKDLQTIGCQTARVVSPKRRTEAANSKPVLPPGSQTARAEPSKVFREQRWKHHLVSAGTQTDLDMVEISTYEEHIAGSVQQLNDRLTRLVRKWQLVRIGTMFNMWKEECGFELITQLKTKVLEYTEADQSASMMLRRVSALLCTKDADEALGLNRAFYLWDADTSLMRDARRWFESPVDTDVEKVLKELRDTTIDLVSTLDPRELTTKIVARAKHMVSAQSCQLFLVDADADIPGEIFNFDSDTLQGLPLNEGFLFQAAIYRESFLLLKPTEHAGYRAENDKVFGGPMENMVVLPLQDEMSMGALVMVNRRDEHGEIDPCGFSSKDLKLLAALLRQVAPVVRNNLDIRTQQTQQARLRALLGTVLGVTSFDTVEEVLEAVPEHACEVGKAGSAKLLARAQSGEIEVVGLHGQDHFPDMLEDPEWCEIVRAVVHEGEATDGPSGSLCIPIAVTQETIVTGPLQEDHACEKIRSLGCLVMTEPMRGFFNCADEVVLTLFAQQIASTLLNLQLFTTAVDSQKQQADVERAAKAAQVPWEDTSLEHLSRSAIVNIEQVLMTRFYPSEWKRMSHSVCFYLRNIWDHHHHVLVMKDAENKFTKHSADDFGGVVRQVLDSSRTIACNPVEGDPMYDKSWDLECDPKSTLVTVPLRGEGQTDNVGCLQISRLNGPAFDDKEIELLETFASKTAIRMSLEQLQSSSEEMLIRSGLLANCWNETTNPLDAIRVLVHSMQTVVGADMATFYAVRNDQGGMCEALLVHSTSDAMKVQVPVIPAGGLMPCAIINKTLYHGAPSALRVYRQMTDAPDDKWLESNTVACILCAPVMSEQDQVVGVLHMLLQKGSEKQTFNLHDVDKAQTVANFLARLTHWAKIEMEAKKMEAQSLRMSSLVAFLCNDMSAGATQGPLKPGARRRTSCSYRSLSGAAEFSLEQLLMHTKVGLAADLVVLYRVQEAQLHPQAFGFSSRLSSEDKHRPPTLNEAIQDSGLTWSEPTASTRFVDLMLRSARHPGSATTEQESAASVPIDKKKKGALMQCVLKKELVCLKLHRRQNGALIDQTGVFNADVDQPTFKSVATYSPTAVVCAPVMSPEGELVGVLQVVKAQPYQYFSTEDIEVLGTVTPCFEPLLLHDPLEAQDEEEEGLLDEDLTDDIFIQEPSVTHFEPITPRNHLNNSGELEGLNLPPKVRRMTGRWFRGKPQI